MQITMKELLKAAEHNKSSDLHLVPDYPLMLRINGELTAINETEPLDKDAILEFIHTVIDQEQSLSLHEFGELDFAYSQEGFSRSRIHIYKQRGTYAVSIRILTKMIPTPKDLLLPSAVAGLIHKKRGLILVTGFAGSGRSTTIAALIHVMAQTYIRNIITIENPIEYIHPYGKSMISQREVGYDTKSYFRAVKAALRQDPDVLFVGEMQDPETILAVLDAAEAGNLVFSTIHSSSTQEAVERIIDIFPDYQQKQIRVRLSNVLEGVIAQQFIKKEESGKRIAAFEVMLGHAEIKAAIRKGKTVQINEILRANKSEGMQTMDDAIFDLYMRSQLTAETAVAYALDPAAMKQKVTI